MEKFEVDPDTGCWMWTGAVNDGGYGVIWVDENARSSGAHRVSFELFNGAIPDGMLVCHKCDISSCVNPDHLWVGDHADNVADMDAKGRRKTRRGAAVPNAVLNEEAVKAIRWGVAIGGKSCADVAKAYGISQTAVWSAVHGSHWAHVDYHPKHRKRPRSQKLNEQAVIVIRHFARAGRPLQDLADAHGIHYQTAYRVAAGTRWSHVDYPTTREPGVAP